MADAGQGPPDHPAPAVSAGWYAVAVLTLANVCALVDRQILAFLIEPIRQDFGLSYTTMAYLVGLPFAVFYTLLGIPVARLADRSNRRNIIGVGIALWSLATAVCGLAGTYTKLLLARIGVGVGEASLQAPGVSMITDYFDRRRVSTAMSVFQTGIFIGSGIAYIISGWVVSFVAGRPPFEWPLLGTVRPWQTVFMVVGLPGLLVALLMFTVREPVRRGGRAGGVPLGEVWAFIVANGRLYALLAAAFTLSAAVNWGIAWFLPTFLTEIRGWTPARAGAIQGLLTVAFGTTGVLAGGRVSDWFVRRGRTDGPLLVGMIGAAGMLVSATVYPFLRSDAALIGMLVIVNVFAAFPWGAVNSAAAGIVPAAMRAQGIALFFLAVNLISQALGPWAVAIVTDRVFRADAALGSALALVSGVGMTGAVLLMHWARARFRSALTL